MVKLGRRARAEIVATPALRHYGAALALTHALTFWFWSNGGVMLSFLSDRWGTPPICWPFFPACHLVEIPRALLLVSSLGYVAMSLVTAWWFVTKWVNAAWWSLLGITVFKWTLLALDYRAMGNYHYMPFLVILTYLFVPDPGRACRYLIVAFYVAAGFLKLNTEWLSGQALFRVPFVTGIWLEWLCIGAVVIELVFAWGLLSRDRVIRALALTALVVFHVFSWHIVGYFYPLIMFLLLLIFPLTWRENSPESPKLRLRLRPIHAALLALYGLAQIVPRLQSGDPALVSRGRMYALDMFDAFAQCHATVIVKFAGESIEVPPDARGLAPRIACDPIVYWNQARRLCREHAGRADFRDVDVFLTSGRSGVEQTTPVMATRDFCAKNPGYNTLFANHWIEP